MLVQIVIYLDKRYFHNKTLLDTKYLKSINIRHLQKKNANKLKLRVRIHYRQRLLPEMRLLTRISIRAKNYRKRYQRERHVQAITTSMDLA